MMLNDVIRQAYLAGSDDLRVFGGLYKGSYYLQQVPEEAAEFICLADTLVSHPRILEVGSAAGGMARLLDDQLVARSIHIIDDNHHPNAHWRSFRLPHGTAEWNADVRQASEWLAQQDTAFDLVFVDLPHEYDTGKAALQTVLPYVEAGGIIALHDTVACNGPDQIGALARDLRRGAMPDLTHVADIGKKLGISVFSKAGTNPPKAYSYPQATLLYHFCPWQKRPEMIEFHVQCLSRYLRQFTKVRITVATGPDMAAPEVIEDMLMPHINTTDVQFFHVPNDTCAECTPLFKHLLPCIEAEENVCYAHSKGAVFTEPIGRGKVWAELMYAHVVGNSRAAIAHLQGHSCVGAFVKVRHSRGAAWHYSGNVFWFRNLQRYPGYFLPTAYQNRYATEAWVGKFVPRCDIQEVLVTRIQKSFLKNRGGLQDRYNELLW